MSEESKRDFSGPWHSTTLLEGRVRALSFAPLLCPPSSTSQRLTDAQQHEPRTPSPSQSEQLSDILRRHLSHRSVIPTTSSFAERMNQAKARANEWPDYRSIGLGSCGSVFEIPETEFAVKKGKNTDALWNDFCLTNEVNNALEDMIQDAFPENTIPKTPSCNFFRTPGSDLYWKANINKFPASHREMGAAFQVNRIHPLPHSVREALIKQYFNDERSIHIWVLDFDKSSRIELTFNDVDKYLVPAFIGNDPYYPRPDVDTELWTRFSKTYLKASRLVLLNKQVSSQAMGLPEIFLDRVASKIKEHEDWDPEGHIMFG